MYSYFDVEKRRSRHKKYDFDFTRYSPQLCAYTGFVFAILQQLWVVLRERDTIGKERVVIKPCYDIRQPLYHKFLSKIALVFTFYIRPPIPNRSISYIRTLILLYRFNYWPGFRRNLRNKNGRDRRPTDGGVESSRNGFHTRDVSITITINYVVYDVNKHTERYRRIATFRIIRRVPRRITNNTILSALLPGAQHTTITRC